MSQVKSETDKRWQVMMEMAKRQDEIDTDLFDIKYDIGEIKTDIKRIDRRLDNLESDVKEIKEILKAKLL